MVSFVPARPSERHVPGTGPVRVPERSSHARALPAADDASLTLGRRIGVLVVLLALGGAIVLAASGGGGDRSSGVVLQPTQGPVASSAAITDPTATQAPPPIVGAPIAEPAFVKPDATLVNTRKVNLRVRVPDPGVPWDGLELRVLRGGEVVQRKSIGPEDVNSKGRVTIKSIPLQRGSNKLSVAFANATGQGPGSDTLSIKLDDQPPRLRIVSPRQGTTIQEDTVTVKGRTGAVGGRVIVRNVTTDQKEEVFADGAGRFEATIGLKRGRDTIKVAVSDAAGNQNVVQVAVVRGNGKAEARLSISRSRIKRSALPRDIEAKVSVLDANGRPIRNARVEFVFGPPGPPTQSREATTSKDGIATSRIKITKDAVVGDGLVTIRVTLPNGQVLNDTEGFRVV
jgi:hypothetical protein